MNRRNFIQLGVSAGVAAIALPKLSMAGSAGSAQHSMAGGVFYTKAYPGRWSKKAAPHLPVIEQQKNGQQLQIQVITPHEMKKHIHYITKHTLLDQDYHFLAEFLFDPIKHASAVSNFTLDNYQGKLYALSHCNKHDTWLSAITV